MNPAHVTTIVCVAWDHIPTGWFPCDGRVFKVDEYKSQYALLGNMYGGLPNATFALPDLRGRAPRASDPKNLRSTKSGVESVALAHNQIPSHNHRLQANSAPASATTPLGNLLSAGNARGIAAYAPPGPTADMNATTVGEAGGIDPHSNMQPYLAMNYLIALHGIWPAAGCWTDDPWTGEIRMFTHDLVPQGWSVCNGSELKISEYPALYALIGTTYGGDGVSTFRIPDIAGRVPIGAGHAPGMNSYPLAQSGGQEKVALTLSQMPPHSHQAHMAATNPTTNSPTGNMLAKAAQVFSAEAINSTLDSNAISTAGADEAHDNMMPFLAVNYCICLYGIYPQE